jgi:hypothetical protein
MIRIENRKIKSVTRKKTQGGPRDDRYDKQDEFKDR